MYEINNLVSLCDQHHCHQSTEGLEQVNMRIAKALHMTLEELLRFAETKSEEQIMKALDHKVIKEQKEGKYK